METTLLLLALSSQSDQTIGQKDCTPLKLLSAQLRTLQSSTPTHPTLPTASLRQCSQRQAMSREGKKKAAHCAHGQLAGPLGPVPGSFPFRSLGRTRPPPSAKTLRQRAGKGKHSL